MLWSQICQKVVSIVQKLENLDFKGINFCPMHFGTQFTHISRQYRVENRKQKLKFKNNCFDNVFFDCWKKGLNFLQNKSRLSCFHF